MFIMKYTNQIWQRTYFNLQHMICASLMLPEQDHHLLFEEQIVPFDTYIKIRNERCIHITPLRKWRMVIDFYQSSAACSADLYLFSNRFWEASTFKKNDQFYRWKMENQRKGITFCGAGVWQLSKVEFYLSLKM